MNKYKFVEELKNRINEKITIGIPEIPIPETIRRWRDRIAYQKRWLADKGIVIPKYLSMRDILVQIQVKVLRSVRHESNEIRIARFKRCIEKDIHNSVYHMPRDVNYPIDERLAQQWVDAFDTSIVPYARDIGKYFIKNTDYISFAKFMEELVKTVRKFNAYIQKSSRSYILVLHTAVDKSKSNEWVAKLIYEYLDPKPIDILSSIDIAYRLHRRINISDDNMIDFLICDDGSFSGTQITQDISILKNNSARHGRLDSTIHVLLPFYSTSVLDKIEIEGITGVVFHTSFHMKTLSEKLKDDLGTSKIDHATYIQYLNGLCMLLGSENDTDYKKNYMNLECTNKIPGSEYKREIIPIYFDYKIPDYMSVYTTIYNTGIPGHVQKITSVPEFIYMLRRFIFNCTDRLHTDRILEGINYDPVEGRFNIDSIEASKFEGEDVHNIATSMLEDKTGCIPTFYKNGDIYRYYNVGELRGYLVNILESVLYRSIKPCMEILLSLVTEHDTITLDYEDVLNRLSDNDTIKLYFAEIFNQLENMGLVEHTGSTITFKNTSTYGTTYNNIFISPTPDNDIIVNRIAYDIIFDIAMRRVKIQQELTGGSINYYKKYQKYKLKYMDLKNNMYVI